MRPAASTLWYCTYEIPRRFCEVGKTDSSESRLPKWPFYSTCLQKITSAQCTDCNSSRVLRLLSI